MEEILFSSQEIDLTFHLSDHSISSDEDLLPIDSYKTHSKGVDSETTYVEKGSTFDSNISSKQTLSKRTEEISETEVKMKSNEMSYYKCCPLCKSLGPKSINHIKYCANKRSLNPKQVLQLLNKCQKSDQKTINCHKSKSNAKQIKRSNKLMDNYVITFGTKKRVEICLNPKLICDKNTKLKETHYELSSLDPIERQRHLMSKINKEIVDNIIERTDKPFVSSNSLPNIWSLSLLDSDSGQYFVAGFEKYDIKS